MIMDVTHHEWGYTKQIDKYNNKMRIKLTALWERKNLLMILNIPSYKELISIQCPQTNLMFTN